MNEKLLFSCCRGTISGHKCGIIIDDSALPIASSGDPKNEDGFYAAWGAIMDVEDFFNGYCGLQSAPENGLWVYEVEFFEKDVDAECEFSHLRNGKLRRPTVEELSMLVENLSPWEGGLVF